MSPRLVTLLGPQRHAPTVAATLESLGVSGRIATITAGWQERELEDQELHEHLAGDTVNLKLWTRSEAIFQAHAGFTAAHHKRQETMRDMRELYNLRLAHAKAAVYALLRKTDGGASLEAERLDALEAVRALDAHHLGQIRELRAAFDATWKPLERPEVVAAREELRTVLADCTAVAIAGGHVAVLLNRLLLFGLADLIGDKPVLAWSAGAMAICDRIVLFHDDPPWGPGNAEVLDLGLDLIRDVVPLPHAARRFRSSDPHRVWVFARRFAPAVCLPLDGQGRADLRDGVFTGPRTAPRLSLDGRVVTGDGKVVAAAPAEAVA